MTFNPGDLVQLRCGSPTLVVRAVNTEGKLTVCNWAGPAANPVNNDTKCGSITMWENMPPEMFKQVKK